MKIYTMVHIDMATGETIEENYFEWNGPVDFCKGGGGSSTTNTVDYAYNARMAALSEEQQAWARDYYNMWQQYQKPYEIAQTQANMEMLPLETELYKQQLTAAKDLLPQQTAAAQKFLTSPTADAFRALRPHWTHRRPPSLPEPGPRPAWGRSRKTLIA